MEVLAPTESVRIRKVVEGIANTKVVEEPSNARRDLILVGWISDPGVRKRREELERQLDVVMHGARRVPLILIEGKTRGLELDAYLKELARRSMQKSR